MHRDSSKWAREGFEYCKKNLFEFKKHPEGIGGGGGMTCCSSYNRHTCTTPVENQATPHANLLHLHTLNQIHPHNITTQQDDERYVRNGEGTLTYCFVERSPAPVLFPPLF